MATMCGARRGTQSDYPTDSKHYVNIDLCASPILPRVLPGFVTFGVTGDMEDYPHNYLILLDIDKNY